MSPTAAASLDAIKKICNIPHCIASVRIAAAAAAHCKTSCTSTLIGLNLIKIKIIAGKSGKWRVLKEALYRRSSSIKKKVFTCFAAYTHVYTYMDTRACVYQPVQWPVAGKKNEGYKRERIRKEAI